MTIEEAIATALWYNDLLGTVESWADLQPNKYKQITEPYFDMDIEPEFKAQLQIVWMILVMLYGEYGTSPRFGWIENIHGFRAFIERLKEFDLGGDNECDW